jgi:hypothetical protein
MRTWIRVIHSTAGAVADFRAHLEELAHAEDSLAKAKTLEELHYQRGKVDGIKAVLFALTANKS